MRRVDNYVCGILMVKSGITQKELIGWGGADVFNQALGLCQAGLVVDVVYNDETLTVSGKILQPDGWGMPVTFHLEENYTIRSDCPCEANYQYGRICPHVVAVGIALWIQEMDETPAEKPAPKFMKALTASSPTPSTEDDEADLVTEPMAPSFRAELKGTRASLSLILDAVYDKVVIPAGSVQSKRVVWLPVPDDPYRRRVRSLELERQAMDILRDWGFTETTLSGDLRFQLANPQGVLDFLGTGLPALRNRGWIVTLSPRLMELTDQMPSVLPLVKVTDAPGGAFDISYEFVIPEKDLVISPNEVQGAVAREEGYLMKNGAVILIDRLGIASLQSVFHDCASRQNGAARGSFRVSKVFAPYVMASLESLGAELDADRAPNWQQTALDRNRQSDACFRPVSLGTLDSVLRPYQKQGVYWMRFLEEAGLCGLLADEMGLGKTLQTLTWISLPRVNPDSTGPALVVCPTSLVRNWEAEAQKWVPQLRTLVISGPDRAKNFSKISHVDLVITSYALVQRDYEEAYCDVRFSVVVLDEAQHVKNRQTKNAITVKLLDCDTRLVLTGTPVENSVSDLWSVFDFLMPGYLGDYEQFKIDFEMPILDGGSQAEAAQARLKRKVHPFILRRLKKTVAKDLPDKIIKVSYCPLSAASEKEYADAKHATRRAAGDLIRSRGWQKSKFEILAMLMKLRRIASRGKQEAFLEQLENAIENGHKILVFSQFVSTLKELAVELSTRHIGYAYLDGSTKERLRECQRFNQSPDLPVFLISLMAGGTGLNLTGADMVIHYDPWWNPAVEDQATDRAHRIGQKKTVFVMKMIASHTVEEKVLEMQERKRAVIAATITTTDTAVMEKLTAADVAALLS